MSGSNSSDAPLPDEPPSPDSLVVDVALARVRARLLEEAAAPRTVDRFVLDRQLGAGGMGTVWSAFDGRLERRVALKFLRSDGATARDERPVFAEAQSLAKLSHPNVIPVYDVGQSDGRVWIAMELVPGRTLRRWIADERPSAAERLRAWRDAGRGLAAVHAAGLVHRDLKPDNVMMGDDGRVRLIDFGLVRRADHRGEGASTRDEGDAATQREGRRGFAGTPAYAAPEQRAGEPVDARADQFAFCVCVWEALTGERPSSEGSEGLRERVLAGHRRVPAGARRALARGLERAPERRFADMQALLGALAPRSLRWVLPAALGAGLVGALAAGFGGAFDSSARDPCAGASAALERHWSASQRRAVAGGRGAASIAVAALDEWGARWADAATQACVEVHVERQRSAESLDRRRACLDGLLDELDVLVESLGRARAGPPPMARLAALGDPKACMDQVRLDGPEEAVPAETRAAIQRLHRALFEVRLGAETVGLDERRGRALELRRAAEALGHRATLGRVRIVEGELASFADDADAARLHYGAAVDLGSVLPDPLLLADAWLGLGRVALELDVSIERSDWLLRRDFELLRALGWPTLPTASAWMHRGRWHLLRGELDEAERATRRAIAPLEGAGPTARWLLAAGLRNLATIATVDGRADEALALHERAGALEADEARPELTMSRGSPGAHLLERGYAELAAGSLDAAATTLSRAVEVLTRERGPRSADVAAAHVSLAAVHDASGALAEARRHALEADRILREAHGVAHPDRVYALSALGTVAFREGAFADAVEAYTRALELAELRPERDAIEVATHRANLGEALLRDGQRPAAERALRQAVEALERALDPADPRLAVPEKALGEALLAGGQVAEARLRLERALRSLIERDVSEIERAETLWALARALAASGEPAAALARAQEAADGFSALGPEWTARAQEINAWIKQERGEGK